jgi:hypothetical protein
MLNVQQKTIEPFATAFLTSNLILILTFDANNMNVYQILIVLNLLHV